MVMMMMMMSWSNFVGAAAILPVVSILVVFVLEGLRWVRLPPGMRKHYSNLPPGSLGIPFLGETLNLQHSLMSATPHSFVNHRRRRYGDFFLTHLFGSPLLASTDPNMSRFILATESKFSAMLPKSIAMAVGKNALLNLQGEKHKRFRRLAMNLCAPNVLKHNAEHIQKLAYAQLKTWTGRKVFVGAEAKEFTFYVMLQLVLGIGRGIQAELFRAAFWELCLGVRSIPIDLPGTAFRKGIQARERLGDIIEAFIEERRLGQNVVHNDLLDNLLHAHEVDGGPVISNVEIVDQILSTILAGFDTSANTLLFLIYYIGQNPQVHLDLKREHEEILQQKEKNELLNWGDYRKMKFTQMAVRETLRLANPVLALHRKILEDVEYNGHILPGGCVVQAWVRSIHTDPNNYPQPYDFDISRWHSISNSKNFIPWGFGPRVCVGMDLAQLELCFFVHCLITTYSWELAEVDTPKFFPAPGMRKGFPIFVHELRELN